MVAGGGIGGPFIDAVADDVELPVYAPCRALDAAAHVDDPGVGLLELDVEEFEDGVGEPGYVAGGRRRGGGVVGGGVLFHEGGGVGGGDGGGGGGPDDVAAEGEGCGHGMSPFSVIDFGSTEKTNRRGRGGAEFVGREVGVLLRLHSAQVCFSAVMVCFVFYDISVANEYYLLTGRRQVFWQVRAGREKNIVNG